MAHFSESLCEEVIRSEGKCGLSKNEMVQMARFALRAIKNENPLIVDAVRYRWLRDQHDKGDGQAFVYGAKGSLDEYIDAEMAAEREPQETAEKPK